MEVKRKKTITKTFCLGFALLLIFLGGAGLLFLNEIKQFSRLTSAVHHHPLLVSNTALQCSLTITRMHRTMQRIALITDPALVTGEIAIVNQYEQQVYQDLDAIRDKIPGALGRSLEGEARALFREWKPIRDQVIGLVRTRQAVSADRITRSKGTAHLYQLEMKMEALNAYARNNASAFLRESQATGRNIQSMALMFLILGLAFFLAIAGLTLAAASRYEGKLLQSEHQHRIIFENSPLGMVRFSADGVIADMNDKFADLMGISRENLPEFSAAIRKTPGLNQSIKTALEGRTAVFEDEYNRLFLRVIFNPVLPGEKQSSVIATLEDITQRKTAEQALKEEEHRLETIFNSVQTGIFIVDRETLTLVDVNAAAERMIGLPKPEMVGQPGSRFIQPAAPGNGPEINSNRPADESEQMLLTAGGDKRPILKTVAKVPIRGRECLLECFVDIGRQKEVEKGLRDARDAAESANRAKADFLANMSHEIRTPMNGVIGMTELLADTGLNPEQQEYVATIGTSADALLAIINDILDHAKIDAGKVELEVMEFNLRTLLEDIADLTALKAHEKGLEYCTIIHSQTPSYLLGDPGRLRQILLNLTGNAVKFTHEGEIVVETRLEHETGNRAVVKFSVTDTGIGIPEDKIDDLFDAFSQADSSTTREFGGTGLGLAISRQLTELMGGYIRVSSAPEKGSCFSFTAMFEKPAPETLREPIPRHRLEGLRILIVDDNDTNRFILRKELANWGCRVDEAPDGDTALKKLNQAVMTEDGYDMAVIDMQMPEMNGAALGRAIRETQDLNRVRMIMLTSMGVRGDARRFKDIGFSGYLNKPVKQRELFDCLSMISLSPREHPEVPEPLITRHVIAENRPPAVTLLLVEDNRINQKVALKALQKLGFAADAVPNGQEALEALAETDYHAVLMDCQMPVMDGYEATRRIRSGRSGVINSGVPVIALTANAMKEDRQKCLDAGMSDYLAKPVKLKDLSAMLSKWLEQAPA